MGDVTRFDTAGDFDVADWAETTARTAVIGAGFDWPDQPGSDEVFGWVWDLLADAGPEAITAEGAAVVARCIAATPPLADFLVALRIEKMLREESAGAGSLISPDGPCGSAARRLRGELSAIDQP